MHLFGVRVAQHVIVVSLPSVPAPDSLPVAGAPDLLDRLGVLDGGHRGQRLLHREPVERRPAQG